MLIRHGEFDYQVLPLGGRRWLWTICQSGVSDHPVKEGEFLGSEGRAHMAAREAIAQLREKRFCFSAPAGLEAR